MNHPEHGWQNAGGAPAATNAAGATATPTGHMGPAPDPYAMPGHGHGAPGAWPHHPTIGWSGGPAGPWYPPPGYAMGAPHYGYGPYGPAGYGAPFGHADSGSAPGSVPPGVKSAGLGAAMGNLADQAGLGMFKDFFSFDDGEFWKGAMVGAAVVLLLTNEGLRDALIGGAAKTAEAVKSGIDNLAGAEHESDTVGEPSDLEDTSQTQPEDLPR
jgi:hypothetical protein